MAEKKKKLSQHPKKITREGGGKWGSTRSTKKKKELVIKKAGADPGAKKKGGALSEKKKGKGEVCSERRVFFLRLHGGKGADAPPNAAVEKEKKKKLGALLGQGRKREGKEPALEKGKKAFFVHKGELVLRRRKGIFCGVTKGGGKRHHGRPHGE